MPVGSLVAYLTVDGAAVAAAQIGDVQRSLDLTGASATRMGAQTDAGMAAAASGTSKLTIAQLRAVAASERYNALLDEGDASTARLASAEASLIAANVRVAETTNVMNASLAETAATADSAFALSLRRAGTETSKLGGGVTGLLRSIIPVQSGFALAGLAVAGVGVLSLKAASDYQKLTVNLVTGAGEQQSALKSVSSGMLSMAGQVGDSAQDLAKAMFLVESAGYHGAAGLQVLKVAAEGARVDNADLTTTVDAVTSALNAYHLGAGDAAEVTNTLIASAAEGKMHLEDLAGSLGTVLPIAADLRIPLDQVGASLATMTMQGTNAAKAATSLRYLIASLAGPSAVAAKAMESVGLSTDEVANSLEHNGLPATLALITDAIGKKFPAGSAAYVSTLKNIVGGTRGWTAALELTGQNLTVLDNNLAKIQLRTELAGNSVSDWGQVQKNFNVELAKFVDGLEAAGIRIGEDLLPVATDLFKVLNGGLHTIEAVTRFLDDNKIAAEGLATVVTVALLPGIMRLTDAMLTGAWSVMSKGLLAVASAATTAGVAEGQAVSKTEALSTAGSRLAKGGLIVGALYGIYEGAKALGDEFQSHLTPSVNKLEAALIAMGTGKSQAAVAQLLSTITGLAKIDKEGGANFLGPTLKAADQALANLVNNNHAPLANADFKELSASLKAAGYSTAEITKLFPALQDALQQTSNEANLAKSGIDKLAKAEAEAAAAAAQAAVDQQKAAISLGKFNAKIATDESIAAMSVHITTAISLYKSLGAATDSVIKQVTDAISASVKITSTSTSTIAADLATLQDKAATADLHALVSHQDSLDATAYAKSLRSVADAADSLASKAKSLADGMASDNDAEKQAKATAEATAAALAKQAKADDAAASAAEQTATRSSNAYKALAQAASTATQQATAAATALVNNLQTAEKNLISQISSFKKSVASSLTQGTDLSSIWQSLVGTDANGNPIDPTLSQVQTTLDSTLAQVTSFTQELTALAKDGATQGLITQILGMGDTAGGSFAAQLLTAGPEAVSAFSAIYKQLDAVTNAEGNTLSKSFYGDGVSSMEQLISGMISKFPDLTKALAPLIETLKAAFTITPTVNLPSVSKATAAKNAKDVTKGSVPAFAGGVSNFVGGLALVGEVGPEIVTLPRGSSVTPHGQIPAAVGGDGASALDLSPLVDRLDAIERHLAAAPSLIGDAVGDATLGGYKAAGKAQGRMQTRNRLSARR